jgi:ribose transport system substrate-binding protein
MAITGLGPHGERAASPLLLKVSEADATEISRRRFSVGVVLHTTGSDWARQQLAGISSMLGQHNAAIVEVVDCCFDASQQTAALTRLAKENIDAVISIPIGNVHVADSHRAIQQNGKKLILLDNAPTGLAAGAEYTCVVSADNFGLGEIAAKQLSEKVKPDQKLGLLSYAVDFFATNEREIAFRKWINKNRSDLSIAQAKFQSLADVQDVMRALLDSAGNLSGLFVVWDEPAVIAADILERAMLTTPIATIDLGNAVAINMAKGGLIKSVGAQRPYDQGKAAATAALLALLDRPLPSWIALPGLAVTRDNVVEAYQTVWHSPAPGELLKSLKSSK